MLLLLLYCCARLVAVVVVGEATVIGAHKSMRDFRGRLTGTGLMEIMAYLRV